MRIAIALSGGGLVVRLSRCEPFAGGMEIFNGFTWRYVARTEHSLARVFFPTRFRKSQDWRNNDGLLSLFGCRLRRGGPEQFCGMLFRGIRNRRCTLGAKLHLGDSNVD